MTYGTNILHCIIDDGNTKSTNLQKRKNWIFFITLFSSKYEFALFCSHVQRETDYGASYCKYHLAEVYQEFLLRFSIGRETTHISSSYTLSDAPIWDNMENWKQREKQENLEEILTLQKLENNKLTRVSICVMIFA